MARSYSFRAAVGEAAIVEGVRILGIEANRLVVGDGAVGQVLVVGVADCRRRPHTGIEVPRIASS